MALVSTYLVAVHAVNCLRLRLAVNLEAAPCGQLELTILGQVAVAIHAKRNLPVETIAAQDAV